MDPYLGEIRIVGFNFAPRGWALCQGQLMAISQNTALFALLGTTYGGDGRATFALPNLQARLPIAPGQLAGGSNYLLGEVGGAATVTLLTSEMPPHAHTLPASTNGANESATPGTGVVLGGAGGRGEGKSFYVPAATQQAQPVTMNPQAAMIAGGGQPHNNLAPYLVLNYVIAMQGVFPPRS